MQQRTEPPDSLDYFPTPPWATRALCEYLVRELHILDLGNKTVAEPACGEGHMARPLAEYFGAVIAGDVFDYTATFPGQQIVADFTGLDWRLYESTAAGRPHFVITNPPFKSAEAFVGKGRLVASVGVALLVRTAFLEGIDRYRGLFGTVGGRPSRVLQFTERVPMHKGRLTATGSTATSYCWILWLRSDGDLDRRVTVFDWIPPCRKGFERAGDYHNPGEDDGPLFGGG